MADYFSGLFATPRMAVAQVIGFIAVICNVICFQQRNRKKILFWQIIVCSLWTLHFVILGVATGSIINGIQILRSFVYGKKETQKWAQWNGWVFIFIGFIVFFGFLTLESPIGILPVVGTTISTISLWLKKPFSIRLLALPSSIAWGVYDALSMSIAGAGNEIISSVSIIIAIFRIDIPAKRKEKTAILSETRN